MVTLKDVAKRANVSITTASYALNDNGLIKEETKQRVLQAAKELGYVRNGLARSLKTQKTNIIALFLSGYTGPIFNEIMQSIQDQIYQYGYDLIVCASNEEHRLLENKHYDGAIILNYHITDENLLRVQNEKTPVVVLDRYLDGENIACVLIDNEQGIKKVMDYLIKLGHQKIGFVKGQTDSFDGEQRFLSYFKMLNTNKLKYNQKWIIEADFTEKSAYEAMKAILVETERDNLPTAYICANDEMAIGIMQALTEAGIKVPEEVTVTGFDNIQLSQYIPIKLTTIDVNRKEFGKIAAQTIHKMIQNKAVKTVEYMKVDLVIRESCANKKQEYE